MRLRLQQMSVVSLVLSVGVGCMLELTSHSCVLSHTDCKVGGGGGGGEMGSIRFHYHE